MVIVLIRTHDSLLVSLWRAVGQATDLQTVPLSLWLYSWMEGDKERVNSDVIVVLMVLDIALSQQKQSDQQLP